MKVNIEHKETKVKTGFFSSTAACAVELSVEFSAEEKATIKKRKLESAVVMERLPPFHRAEKMQGLEDVFDLAIRHLIQGKDTYILPNPSAAKEYEANLMPQLVRLKDYIKENAEVDGGKKTFEL